MNDLRSSSQAVDTGSEAAAGISSTPPRNRPDRVAERGAKKMSRRQSIAERARQEAVAEAAADSVDGQHDESIELTEVAAGTDGAPDGETLVDDETLNAKLARRASQRPTQRASRRAKGTEGPDGRPSRRRAAENDEDEGNEDRFPWNFQFDEDDEPRQLQASTPLLSRAFRATTG